MLCQILFVCYGIDYQTTFIFDSRCNTLCKLNSYKMGIASSTQFQSTHSLAVIIKQNIYKFSSDNKNKLSNILLFSSCWQLLSLRKRVNGEGQISPLFHETTRTGTKTRWNSLSSHRNRSWLEPKLIGTWPEISPMPAEGRGVYKMHTILHFISHTNQLKSPNERRRGGGRNGGDWGGTQLYQEWIKLIALWYGYVIIMNLIIQIDTITQ